MIIDMKDNMNYTVIRSDRKTLALQIKDGEIIVRAPMRVRDKDIKKFVESHADWVEKQLSKREVREDKLKNIETLTEKEAQELAKAALDIIPKRVEYYAGLLGVSYGKISVRMQKTRWGSCSSKGDLSFNCLLMLAPEEILDSVVLHELCHRKEMNHSQRFYREIERIMPDYQKKRAWLREHGDELMKKGGKL